MHNEENVWALSDMSGRIEHMFDTDLSVLDEPATLAAAEHARAVVEQGEVRLLQTAAYWADLHGDLARATSPLLPGSEKLVRSAGTARREWRSSRRPSSVSSWRRRRRRRSGWSGTRWTCVTVSRSLWARIVAGEVKPWIGRRTAEATRHLSLRPVAVVDVGSPEVRACACRGGGSKPSFARVGWGVILRLPLQPIRRRRDRWGCDGFVTGAARRPAGGGRTAGPENRSAWMGLAAERGTSEAGCRAGSGPRVRPQPAPGTRPHALDLFAEIHTATGHPEPAADPADSAESTSSRPRRPVDTRPDVTLYVHLTDQALQSGTGVARVEQIGPVTVDRVRTWLAHANVTVKPVIDLHNQVPVDAYEIPDRIREAVHLAIPVDCFPYATSTRTYRRHRPHHPLRQTRRRRSTGPDRRRQARPHHPLPPPGQNPRRLAGRPTLHRRLRVAHPPRPLLLVDHTGTHQALPARPALPAA